MTISDPEITRERLFMYPTFNCSDMGQWLHAFAKDEAPDQVTWKIAKAGFLKMTPLSFAEVNLDNLSENQRQIVAEATLS